MRKKETLCGAICPLWNFLLKELGFEAVEKENKKRWKKGREQAEKREYGCGLQLKKGKKTKKRRKEYKSGGKASHPDPPEGLPKTPDRRPRLVSISMPSIQTPARR